MRCNGQRVIVLVVGLVLVIAGSGLLAGETVVYYGQECGYLAECTDEPGDCDDVHLAIFKGWQQQAGHVEGKTGERIVLVWSVDPGTGYEVKCRCPHGLNQWHETDMGQYTVKPKVTCEGRRSSYKRHGGNYKVYTSANGKARPGGTEPVAVRETWEGDGRPHYQPQEKNYQIDKDGDSWYFQDSEWIYAGATPFGTLYFHRVTCTVNGVTGEAEGRGVVPDQYP